jgi:hypothetical protein
LPITQSDAEIVSAEKEKAAQRLEVVLNSLLGTSPNWQLRAHMGYSRVRVDLDTELDNPKFEGVAEFNYNPLSERENYAVVICSKRTGSDTCYDLSCAVLNRDEDIWLYVSPSELVEWLIPSTEPLDVQIGWLAVRLHPTVQAAEEMIQAVES